MSTPQKPKTANVMKTAVSFGALRHLIFMAGIALSVAVGIGLYASIRDPLYRPLDYQVNQKNMAAIADTLEKAGIRYKINDRDGVVLVPAADVDMAKIKLAAASVPKDDGFNFSFLNEQNSLADSQFLENARYLRALENDLAKTIEGIKGISNARVHIAVPRNNVFADENNKVTASVVINIEPTFANDRERIRSILQLVADSVPGLDPKNISITDQYGHFLSDGMDQNSVYNAAQLSYQNNLQNYYEKRIETMVASLLGDNKVIVRVNADINFTQQEQANEDYDPQKSVILSEHETSEETNAAGASGTPGALANTPPQSGGKAGSSSSSGEKRTQSTKNYNVSKSVTYKKTNVAEIKSLSVAVVVDNEQVYDEKTKKMVSTPLSADKIKQITDLVKAAIGYDEKRGDIVTVVNSSYSQRNEILPAAETPFYAEVWVWDMLRKTLGFILGFIFLVFLYKKLSNYAANIRFDKPVSKSVFEPEADDSSEHSINRMHDMKQDGITRLKQIAVNEPNKMATIIKSWIRK